MRWLFILVLALAAQGQEFQVSAGLDGAPAPVVAARTGEILVAWHETGQIVARRFGLDGKAIDPGLIVVAEAESARVSVASDGSGYLIAWAETRGTHARVAAVVLSGDGTLSEPAVLFDGEREGAIEPKVSAGWSGSELVVAWSDPLAVVHAATIGAQGEVRSRFDVAGPFAYVDDLFVAPGLIVYSARTAAYEAVVEAVADQKLVQLDRIAGSPWGCNGSIVMRSPSAVWTGTEWVVAWKRSSCRQGESVVMARLSGEGNVIETRTIT